MQALHLRKKYPEVSQDEMLDLVNRFKSVYFLPVSTQLPNCLKCTQRYQHR